MPDSITLTHRTDQSIPTLLLQTLIKPFKPSLTSPGKQPFGEPGTSPQLSPQAKYKCTITQRRVSAIYCYDVSPPTSSTSHGMKGKKKKRVYYFAGGGFIAPPSKEHWCMTCELARRLGDEVVVSMVSPPLAPATTADVGLEMLREWCKAIVAEAGENGEEVVFMGDSSGGNLALCCALFDGVGEGIVKAVVLVSPSLDLEKANPEMKVAEKADPVQTITSSKKGADLWRGGIDGRDTRISPLYADLSVLQRRVIDVYCVSGSHDVLHPDTLLMREKLNKAGVKGEWFEWDKQMHCFPLAWMYGLPESKAGKEWLVEVMKRI